MPRFRALALIWLTLMVGVCSYIDEPSESEDKRLDVRRATAPIRAAMKDAPANLPASRNDPRDEEPRPESCPGIVPDVYEEDDRFSARTEHYHLSGAETAAQANDFVMVLEASWQTYERFFGVSGELQEPLEVRTFESSRLMWAEIVAIAPHQRPERSPGYYLPANRTAYHATGRGRSADRALLIHEATHQFHHVVAEEQAVPEWYAEGIAEYLSQHEWDGECLRLGVRPLLSRLNVYDQAARASRRKAFDLASLLRSDSKDRSAGAALVAFFDRSHAGDFRDAFATFRTKLDRGRSSAVAGFVQSFGAPQKYQPDFEYWLDGAVEPFEIVFGEWDALDAESVRGSGARGAAIAVGTGVFETLEFTAASLGAGVVFGFDAPSTWTAIQVTAHGLVQWSAVSGQIRRRPLQSSSVGTSDIEMAVRLEGQSAMVHIGAEVLDFPIPRGRRSGIFVEGGTSVFNDIRFTTVP